MRLPEKMVLGLLAATNTTGDARLDEARKILATHDLACACSVCMAFVEAASASDGIMAAVAAVEARKGHQSDADTP